MQGIDEFIPTVDKIRYLNQLLKVGFSVLDCGSFVSPRYVPQMKDTAEVIDHLYTEDTYTKLSVIVANMRGAKEAVKHRKISYLGYPFSISETFQLRNTNATIEQALENVKQFKALCEEHDKEFVVYISMAFGNPYDDEWSVEIAEKWVGEIEKLGIKYLSLSDTVGVAQPEDITHLFGTLTKRFPSIEFGAHFHTNPNTWEEKVRAAYDSGCKRFDGAIKGFGGCPMAKDELVGNMPTENLLQFFDSVYEDMELDREEFQKAMLIADEIFPK